MSVFKRATPVFLAALTLFCVILGYGWLSQTPSFEELYGDTVRSADYFWGMKSVGGWLWWTPNYLKGHSQAFLSVCFLPLVVFVGFAAAVSPWLPAVAAYKILGIAIIFCGGLAMYSFAKRLLDSPWFAAALGFLYASSAQFVMRVAMLEHLSTAACMIFAPLVLLRLLRCEEKASWRNALLLAMCLSAMALSYLKILLLFLPAAGIFLFWRLWQSSDSARRNLIVGCLRGALITAILGVVPVLPMLREGRWLAGFEMEPFDGWQQAYSFFTGLSWIDYGNLFTAGSQIPSFQTNRHPYLDFYLGGTILLGILAPIWLAGRRPEILPTLLWRNFRIFCGLFLLAAWLSSGPRSLFVSHMAFLSGSFLIPDISIVLAWAMLILQGVIIWRVWTGSRHQAVWASLCLAIYFFVPGFRLLELLSPFQNIRAPNSIWTAFGVLAAVAAAGIGWRLAVECYRARWQRFLAIAVVVALTALDIAFLHREFFRPGLPEKTFTDFEEAQHALANGPIAGSVLCLSGRYFYLTTPKFSGRAVATEALLRHVQSRWIRQMEKRSQTSFAALKAYYDLFGIAYILIDRKDTDSVGENQDPYDGAFPQVFQNEYFTVLENKDSLAPAYLCRRVLRAPKDSFLFGEKLLELGDKGFASVEAEEGVFDGRIESDGTENIPGEVLPLKPERLRLQAPRMKNYHQFTVDGLPSDARGLMVVTEVYHPDWRAEQNGVPLAVHRAMGALISVQIKKTGPVTFTFAPPWWYGACMGVATTGWALAFVALAFFRLPITPPTLRKHWQHGPTPPALEAPQYERTPISKPLVIIPTWNEVASINEAIGSTLTAAPNCHILVVDDSSSDGTVEAVKKHPQYPLRLFLLERPGKNGLGSAYREGFDWALERNYDACIEMDADLSHNPTDIARLLKILDEGADAAIGSRYIGGVRVLNWPQSRLFLSLGASQFVRLTTGLPLTDGTSGFKALRAEALRRLDWKKFVAEGYGFQVELHYFLWKSQAILVEAPIVFTERREGKSKMTVGIAIEAFCRVLRLGIFGK